jgi:radical SAM-linked protein
VNGRPEPSSEIRQRWRMVVRRGAPARDLPHREIEAAWDAGLARSALPVAVTGGARPRPRLVFGAPVPVGVTAEREPLDLFLSRRLTIAEVRAGLVEALPPGHALVELHDVWLGEASVTGRVVGADYRVELDGPVEPLARAIASMLAAEHLPRAGRKGDSAKAYDLRTLIASLSVAVAHSGGAPADGGPSIAPGAVLRMRLRHQPEVGNGRPDEVLAALGEATGTELHVRAIVRERLLFAGET